MIVTFIGEQRPVRALSGQTVMDAAIAAGLPIDGTCGGRGTCGRCRVRIISGSVETADPNGLLTEKEKADGICLACCTRITGDMTAELLQNRQEMSHKDRGVSLPAWFIPEKAEGIGAAIDIGTTTAAVMLWDLETGASMGASAFTNPQTSVGADVISRINYIIAGGPDSARADRLRDMQRMLVRGLNESIRSLAETAGGDLRDIRRITVCGNSTMSHIFTGTDPACLVTPPYKPAYRGSILREASALGLSAAPGAQVYTAPGIAGHVGADITAGLLASDLPISGRKWLYIDIGTNGEIAAGNGERMICCSTAAGPAFEGWGISQGMRAAKGAIEKVKLGSSGAELGIIGEESAPGDGPAGICGSGIIDAAAEMLRTGIMDSSGRIRSEEELLAVGVSPALAGCADEDEEGRVSFLLYSGIGGEVAVTQKDIREIQLAKASVAAGADTLLHRLAMSPEDLDEVCIAGAFGSYIDSVSARRIGLIPNVPAERIRVPGNLAGEGISMMLLSEQAKKDADRIAENTEHAELSEDPYFQKKYIEEMNFQAT